jgi:4,5-dihydroxyphthalate decarboxylase
VTLACGDYDRTRALTTGEVEPVGVKVEHVRVHEPGQLFRRLLDGDPIDVSELSMANYLAMVSRDDFRFLAIPVFTYRAFRHSMLWVRRDAGIDSPQGLAGRRVGIPEYGLTALLYLRGMLSDDHGVRPKDIAWVRVRAERLDLSVPSDVTIEDAPSGTTLDQLIAGGNVDAVASFTRPEHEGRPNGDVRRLFDDVIAVEGDYYRRTGVFPIMHLVVIRRDLATRHPWLAASLLDAFERAKAHCYEMANHDYFAVSTSLTPWLRIHAEQAAEIIGGDLYPYGVQANLPTLEAAARYADEQHITSRRVDLDDARVFDREAMSTAARAVPAGAPS